MISLNQILNIPEGKLLVPRASHHNVVADKASSWNVLHMKHQVTQDQGLDFVGRGVP